MSRVRITRRALVASLVIAGVLSAPPLQSQTSRPARPPDTPDPARIYLLRGLFGVFSHGIDQLAERLNAQGYSTVLLGWNDAQKVVSEIEAAHRAGDTSHIILIGHSLGSNAAGGIANVLDQKDIPVDLVVTFDVTDPMQASANVGRFINFFQFNGFGRPVTPGPGFQGDLQNVDLSGDTSLNHGNIDESARLQAIVLERVFDVTHQHVQTASSVRKGRRS